MTRRFQTQRRTPYATPNQRGQGHAAGIAGTGSRYPRLYLVFRPGHPDTDHPRQRVRTAVRIPDASSERATIKTFYQ